MNKDKDFLLNESKTFCVFPWTHLHVTPIGTAAPCCISESCNNHEGVGDAASNKLMDLVNSPKMEQLRLDMLNGVKSSECKTCYRLEQNNITSFRQDGIRDYPDTIEDVINNTNEDGSLSEFNMRYFDMRFSNICNFKCRTCGQEYSSQWEQENARNNVSWAKTFPKRANSELLQDTIDQLKNVKKAYFAGGEPFITDEHYVLLEELIRQGHTNVELVYNSNISNLKYKNKDLIGLWKHFNNRIDIYASIDHVKERAEYIRHGTDWATVEQNFKAVRSLDYVNVTTNTVLSIFNFLTIDQFYEYMISNALYTGSGMVASLNCTASPAHISCHFMPIEFKHLGNQSLERAINLLKQHDFRSEQISQIEQALPWALSHDTWNDVDKYGTPNKIKFRQEIERLDRIRGESFQNVFPELIPLLEQTYE